MTVGRKLAYEPEQIRFNRHRLKGHNVHSIGHTMSHLSEDRIALVATAFLFQSETEGQRTNPAEAGKSWAEARVANEEQENYMKYIDPNMIVNMSDHQRRQLVHERTVRVGTSFVRDGANSVQGTEPLTPIRGMM